MFSRGWSQPPVVPATQSSHPAQPESVFTNAMRPSVRLELDPANVVWAGQFARGTETQEVDFNKPVKGRYFCLETLSAQDGRAYAAVAELDLLGATGYPLDSEGWKVAYADSEEHERENGSAENAIDGNPATYWHTQWGSASPNHPHHLVLDLGKSCTLSGFRYLPRPGEGLPGGRIRDYRVYVGDHLVEKFSSGRTLPDKCYLLSYFTGGGDDGLHLAYSLNGYRWAVMNYGRSPLKPEVGGKLMRDPCLRQAP
ncbi:MAG TPA: discoidin domain-containing protein, partial [Candidatus Binatia bacterium]|nr:discoidin domain-containing protein [Candidatus Binatia bacterium]